MPGHDHGHDGSDDKGWSLLSLGHQHEQGEVPVDAATQQELDRQLALTQRLAAQYPTVAAATAAGYVRGGPFAPGLGTHYVGFSGGLPLLTGTGPITDAQILRPILMFNGVDPDSALVGFMYMQVSGGGGTPPQGFAGPNDHWHYHTNLCVAAGKNVINLPLGSDQDVTAAQCTAQGGVMMPVTGYMLHVWSVPGWENPNGVFADLNPKLTCKDGTYHRIPLDQIGTNTTVCQDEAVIR